MQMTYEQAMRPGFMHAFAARRGSGYMMRSEKRGGAYGNGSRKPPRRKKAGFGYIFLTLLISVILWPLGMVMLWRRKVRLQAGTKLLISLLTLCVSVFLIVFALTMPVDNPQFTAFQDKANDWLDKAAADVAVAGDAALKKGGETWHVMSDFAVADADYALKQGADVVDKGVELAGQARAAIEGVFNGGKPKATEAPEITDAPEDAATDTPETATEAPEEEVTEAPKKTKAPKKTEAPEDTGAPEDTPEATDAAAAVDIHLPEEAPDPKGGQPLGDGALHADGTFEAGAPEATEASGGEAWAFVETPTEAPAEATEEPAEATEEPVEATEAPAEATEQPAEATEQPVEATEQPVEVTDEPVEATEEPTAEPTEEPTGEPTKAPVTFTVKPAGDATVYYYDSSKGFHAGPNRHEMNGAPAHTLAEAFAAGKRTCVSCDMPKESILSEAHIAWVDADNCLHTTDECESFKGQWKLMSLADAVAEGCTPCADCGATAYVESIYPAPTPTPEPVAVSPATPLKAAGELTVYYYDKSKGYHVSASCKGMNNAPAHTLAEAQAAGKRACGICKPATLELIGLPVLWLDEDGRCHTSDECAAFKGKVTLIARDDALEQGLPACPDCGAEEYLVPGTVLAQ